MTATRYSPHWLRLREPADAAARAADLLGPLRRGLPAGRELVIRDLGCGTGAMGRWLAGRLPGPQRWILHDQDPELLELAAASLRTGRDEIVAVETRQGDITRLTASDLADTGLVTASALLDLLTGEEVDRLAAACVAAGCPALLTLSVVGRVVLRPADQLDAEIAAAFDAHQQRTIGGRTLLGPAAAAVAADAFTRHGAAVRARPSPWQLGSDQAALIAHWLTGWVGAAREQQPKLAEQADGYLRRRLDAAVAGELTVVVDHCDVLALPPTPESAP